MRTFADSLAPLPPLLAKPLCALLLTLLITGPAGAQAPDSTVSPAASGQRPVSNEAIDQQYRDIRAHEQKLSRLQSGAGKSVLDGSLIDEYVAGQQVDLIAEQIEFMRDCLKQTQPGASCRQQSVDWLAAYPQQLRQAYRRAAEFKLPAEDSSPTDTAKGYARLFDQLAQLDRQDELFIESLALAREFGVYNAQFETRLRNTLNRRAASTAVLLDRTLQNTRSMKEAASLLPGDKDLPTAINSSESRGRKLGAALDRVAGLLKQLGVDTRDYEELVVTATGQLSAGTFSSGLVTEVLAGWSRQAMRWIVEEGPGLIVKLCIVLAILLVAWRIAAVARKVTSQALRRSGRQISQLLHQMAVNTVGNLIIAIGLLVALSQVGISLGPLLAGLGVAGFVVGFALQDTLSNFASGVMILIYSPFDVGDVVETGGVFGKVSHMSLVNTTILTFDNQTIVVPNNKIWGEVIKNLTHQNERRVDMVFGIAYGADIDKAEQILNAIIAEDEQILDEPEPIIRLHELGDSSVNFVVRPWSKTEDYWDVFWRTTREVKKRFDAEGIEIPFPQRDVHLDTSGPLTVRVESGEAKAD